MRLIAQVVTALVRRPDSKPVIRQRGDLLTPTVPEFRKSVQQNNPRTMICLRLGDVQAKPICRHESETELRQVRIFHNWTRIARIATVPGRPSGARTNSAVASRAVLLQCVHSWASSIMSLIPSLVTG